MSIPFSGTLRKSGGVVSAIGKQLKQINLKGVKRINVTFDPFSENVKSTREFLFFLSTPKVSATNPKCVVRTEVVCDNRAPEIKFSLIDSVKEETKTKEIKLLSSNLTTLELLQLCNKHVSAVAPPEDLTVKIQTKSEKKAAGGKGGGKKK
uniref:Large ribosomal subunit protein mL53 n=1 Tax=Megaselia scalaris TaxID=36166 RepID=T1GGZ1_MEGSC